MDLYDDHEYWRCGDDSIIEEDPEEDPEEGVHKGEASAGDSMDKIFTDSNTTP